MISYSDDAAPVPEGTIVIERGVSSQEFAPRLNRTAADVVRFLLKNGEMVTATMTLSDEQMELFALEIGAEILLVEPGQQEEMELQALFDDSDDDDEAAQELRPPVITVMGHVDHGKTTLLDKIRNANVVSGEAGGITQHIGAYQVVQDGKKVTFIDTPGHAAFTQMRARGAQVTDIVVLMVAADDGVMPQTIEAISHARAAGVPMVVAINKVDKENADVQRVLAQLAEQQLVPESWGGDTICVEMSAQQNLGVDDLIEQLTIVAEIEELTANPSGRAKGVVLEANLDTGRGPVATILVDKGTLKVGDPIVAGGAWGRVRAMIDDKGKQIKEAGPSLAVGVLGLTGVPQAGDTLTVVESEARAREVAAYRAEVATRKRTGSGPASLESMFSALKEKQAQEYPLVIKADVQGTVEAIVGSLAKIPNEDIKARVLHAGVGGITESDVTLARASGAPIIGFNVRANAKAREIAERNGVALKYYDVIYDLLDEIRAGMAGQLGPEYFETVVGRAEIKDVFPAGKHGKAAGILVVDGFIRKALRARITRDDVIIYNGAISSLRRFKDDVPEVRAGLECGVTFESHTDIKAGDYLETFEVEERERTI